MLRYIYTSLLFFIVSFGYSQEVVSWNEIPRGFTLGVNVAGPVYKLLDSDRSGISFLTRINIKEDLFFFGELGFENISFEKTAYSYDSNGSFLKVGAEIDMLPRKEAGSFDNLLIGLHYGFALHEQEASSFFIENGYWDDYSGSIASNTVNTHWVELSAGPRAEVFKNLYLSWNLHIRVSLTDNNNSILEPYIIPGFGSGDNRLNAGFSYVLEYLIPWNRR